VITEDRETIERVLAGDPEAFNVLVRKYSRMAGAIAFGIAGDFSSAEDIVQDAFLKAYRSLGALRDRDKFRVWLAGIVRTGALDFLRRRKATPVLPFSQVFPEGDGGILGDSEPAGPASEDLQIQKETREKVLEAVRELAQEDRLVVTLKHMEGLSYKEIAELTRSTVAAVESRLFRARQELKRKLDRTLRK